MSDNNNKGTVYQQLNSFFNFDGMGFAPTMTDTNTNKVIIKGDSIQDVRRKGLELEQKRELQNKFFRTTDRGFQKALQYEAARLPAYIDYEGMEYYPIISSALDLFMEESTTIGVNGKMLNIYSNKERIKSLLEEFFYDIINVNVNLPFWVRNIVKYGDNFVLLYGERKKGITHVKQMVNYEVERFERIQNGKPVVKFKERMTGDEFNVFEVAHFRLLGDDKYLPYGSSVLNKVRRVFRQLVMAEDAMLTYRIIRAGEKKVFKIDVGNIDEEDVDNYIYKIATKFKKTPQVQPNDGQIDYRFNILGNDEDYFLPMRNSNSQTGIETLPGADNLDKIQDIEYLRDNLFMGLGVPKPFLSFQDAAGGGKNMAQYDVRFAKKINRIQQAAIQELNKMAMIHLYLLGYDKADLTDFTLTLTNPSIQNDLLKSNLLREQAQTYRDLTSRENGIGAMSHTSAKRILMNMSDKEIVEDLKQQLLENVVMQELADAPVSIKKTGLFTDIENRYGEINPEAASGSTEAPEGGGGPGGAEGGQPPIKGLPNQFPSELPPVQAESKKTKRVLTQEDIQKYNEYIDKLVFKNDKNFKKKEESKTLIKEFDDKKNHLNQTATNMINEIDSILKDSNKLNKKDSNNDENSIHSFKLEDLDVDDIQEE